MEILMKRTPPKKSDPPVPSAPPEENVAFMKRLLTTPRAERNTLVSNALAIYASLSSEETARKNLARDLANAITYEGGTPREYRAILSVIQSIERGETPVCSCRKPAFSTSPSSVFSDSTLSTKRTPRK
jgi:hypothetical protein